MTEPQQRGRASGTGGRVFALAFKSLWHRRLTAGLTVLAVAVGVAALTSVERVRAGAQATFANTISGADLIVGARGGPMHLVLYSVFGIGEPTNNISWESYRAIASRPEVAWTIPLSLGDAHRGYRVLGTNAGYFEHYRFGQGNRLRFAAGAMFASDRDAVLGAEVADALGYGLGDSIIVSHGIGDTSFQHHDDNPFRVVGVLARTGTPVDRTVHVTLGGIRAMHDESGDDHGDHAAEHDDEHDAGHHDEHDADHHDEHEEHDADEHGEHDADGHDEHEADAHDDHDGHEAESHDEHDASDHDGHEAESHDEHDASDHDEHEADSHAEDQAGEHDHDEHEAESHDEHEAEHEEHESHDDAPSAITACIVGLEARPLLLLFQRFVNEYEAEPLLAAVPGVALQRLWELVGVVEIGLLLMSVLVVVAGLVGMLAMLLAGVAERRPEMAVLRAVGAGRGLVFGLIVAEAVILAAGGAVVGVVAVHAAMLAARGWVLERFGLALAAQWPGWFEVIVIGLVALTAALVALVPAWRLYRGSSDSLGGALR